MKRQKEENLTKESKTDYDSVELSPSKCSAKIVPSNRNRKANRKSDDVFRRDLKEKPDGGWGWVVVFGVAFSNFTTNSLVSVFGLLFSQRLSEIGVSTRGATIIFSVQTTCVNLSGLLIGPLLRRLSFRQTAMIGAFLVVSGLLLTLLSDSVSKFAFTYGLFTGLGIGLLSSSTFLAVDSYFSSKKGRAVGLSVTGTGMGQMILPIVVEYLLREYGFNGTILILAGLALHAFLGATLYQPVKWHFKSSEVTELEETSEDENVGGYEFSEFLTQKTNQKKKLLSRVSRALNLELMKNSSYLNLIIGLALIYVANTCFSMLMPFFLENIDYSKQKIAVCMSVLSGADILGRLIVPVFRDQLKIKSKTVLFTGAALSAVVRSALVWQRSFETILAFAFLCGLIRSALICNFNLSISEEVDDEKVPSAVGLHMLFKALAVMTFAPLIGFVRDYTKSYELSMHILNIFFLALPFFVWLVKFLCVKKRRKINLTNATLSDF